MRNGFADRRAAFQHGAIPADLAVLIAAALPDPADQEAAGLGPPPAEPPAWPWPGDALRARLADARAALGLSWPLATERKGLPRN